jgi:hypothetical protein
LGEERLIWSTQYPFLHTCSGKYLTFFKVRCYLIPLSSRRIYEGKIRKIACQKLKGEKVHLPMIEKRRPWGLSPRHFGVPGDSSVVPEP